MDCWTVVLCCWCYLHYKLLFKMFLRESASFSVHMIMFKSIFWDFVFEFSKMLKNYVYTYIYIYICKYRQIHIQKETYIYIYIYNIVRLTTRQNMPGGVLKKVATMFSIMLSITTCWNPENMIFRNVSNHNFQKCQQPKSWKYDLPKCQQL